MTGLRSVFGIATARHFKRFSFCFQSAGKEVNCLICFLWGISEERKHAEYSGDNRTHKIGE